MTARDAKIQANTGRTKPGKFGQNRTNRAQPGKNGHYKAKWGKKTGETRQKKKRANKTEGWPNKAKLKVSPNLGSVSRIPKDIFRGVCRAAPGFGRVC